MGWAHLLRRLAELAHFVRSVRTHEARGRSGAVGTDGVGFEPTRQGCCPHALQACALVLSATRPKASGCAGGIESRRRGWDGLTCFAGSPSSRTSFARFEPTRLFRVAPQAEYRPTPLHTSQAEGVGFEPTRLSRVNALAGRRLKPLGHPSASCVVLLIGPPGLEPGIFWSRARRVANSTTGQRAYRSRVRHQGARGSDTGRR